MISLTLIHLVLYAPDLGVCIVFYETSCDMRAVHRRPGRGLQIVWMAELDQKQRSAPAIVPSGQLRSLVSDDYSHFGFALSSRAAVDDLACYIGATNCLVWVPCNGLYPVGYYCGLHDSVGNYMEFSYSQPLGLGFETLLIPRPGTEAPCGPGQAGGVIRPTPITPRLPVA